MDDHPRLLALRRLWTGCTVGVVVLAGASTLVATNRSTLPEGLPLGLAVAVGAAAGVAVVGVDHFFAASPPADDAAALAQLRGRLVLQALIATSAVLVCTVIAVLFGPRWTVAIGGIAAVAALLRVRPTRARLARFDAAWRGADRDVSLQRAVRRT